jgi:hypothetical protein
MIMLHHPYILNDIISSIIKKHLIKKKIDSGLQDQVRH